MKVYVETVLECSPELAWAEVQTSGLLREVMYPWLRFVPPRGATFPFRWEQNTIVFGRCYLFGLLPTGMRSIRFERIDSARRQIQTHETDRLVDRWDHLISIREAPDGQSLYSDEIEIEAGCLTWIVATFARHFYRHRQRRWRKIARRLSAARSSVLV
jgi:hypothetical protein